MTWKVFWGTLAKLLQMWSFQPDWLPQQEPQRNSVLGAGLKENISLAFAQFPVSFLQIANLGQNVVFLGLSTLKYVHVHDL